MSAPAHIADAASDAQQLIEREILRTKLDAVVEEMGVLVANSAPAWEVSHGRDFAVALTDAKGSPLAVDNPAQLGTLASSARALTEYFKFDMHEGDVVLMSDPYRGGTHVQDWTTATPVVVGNAIVFFLFARAHVRDVGGRRPGNFYPEAAELLAEGVPISPVKIARWGRPARDIRSTVLLNSRDPQSTERTLDALVGALELGRDRALELIGSHGLESVLGSVEHAQSYGERRARATIAAWTDGTYLGERTLEHDGAGGEPVTVRVEATVDGDGLVLDLSASDDQRRGFVNSTAGNTLSFALLPLISAMGDDAPCNAGVLRAVELRTRPGSLVDPLPGAPVGWSPVHCGLDVTAAVLSALRGAVPGGLAALAGAATLVTARSVEPLFAQRRWLDYSLWNSAGASATETQDGWGRPAAMTRAWLPSAEQWERDTQTEIRSYEFVTDSGGAGAHRGVPGVELRMAVDPAWHYTICALGCGQGGAGEAGGRSGLGAAVTFGSERCTASHNDAPVDAGQIAIRFGGGGGHGDPLRRDADRVLDDVLDGYVSLAEAEACYGVVLSIAGTRPTIDEEATAARRSSSGK